MRLSAANMPGKLAMDTIYMISTGTATNMD